MNAKILIIEDEKSIRDMLRTLLSRSGFEISESATGLECEADIRHTPPDLILLDWMLPDISGIELAKRLKRDPQTRKIPIILVTAKGEEEDKVKGLECGADDYVTKPFSPKELVARIKALLRRTAPNKTGEKIEVAPLSLDPLSHRVMISDQPIELGPTEFRLLHFLMTHQDRVFNRTQLLDNVWGTNVFVEERTVDVHIRRLRKAISFENCERFIQTVRGTGYRFSASAETL
jgi:two-component system phosphate regulon response regulator PhoB